MIAPNRGMPGPLRGLSGKLIAIILVAIVVVEVIVYLPLLGNYRASWLDDRIQVGIVAARVLDAVPDAMALPQSLTDRLLVSAGATALVYRQAGQSQLLQLQGAPTTKTAVLADMRVRDPVTLISGALDTMLFGRGRTLRIVGDNGARDGGTVEVLMSEAPLKRDMIAYSVDFVLLGLIIAMISSVALYLTVTRIFLVPIRRLTANMVDFREAPENATLIIKPEGRRDEIGVAEAELAAMETDLFTMLRQRRHLAEVGLAVAKINHDLRNTLSSAQLLSDQVATLDDPKVQRLAPRLVNTLDRAISFAQSVLDYGRQSVVPPRPRDIDLHLLIEEAAAAAALSGHPTVGFSNEVPEGFVVHLDTEQFGRVFLNLLKNAREALEGAANNGNTEPRAWVELSERADAYVVAIVDNGPGVPERARNKLFVAFEGSARPGGTGLGLAIARELVEAHGGKLDFVSVEQGTRFEITMPAASRVR